MKFNGRHHHAVAPQAAGGFHGAPVNRLRIATHLKAAGVRVVPTAPGARPVRSAEGENKSALREA